MKRREALMLPAVFALPSCLGKVEMEVVETPWEMWGSDGSLNLSEVVGGAPGDVQSVQLTNVTYRRPETFAFFLFAEIVSATPNVAIGDLAVNVDFQIAFGVGRARFQNVITAPASPAAGAAGQQGMVRFGWRRFVGNNIPAASLKWSQKGSTPVLDENDGTSTRREVDFITAQNIVVNAAASVPLFTGPPLSTQLLTLRVGSFFCPLVHMRPDWFKGDFLGGETRGR